MWYRTADENSVRWLAGWYRWHGAWKGYDCWLIPEGRDSDWAEVWLCLRVAFSGTRNRFECQGFLVNLRQCPTGTGRRCGRTRHQVHGTHDFPTPSNSEADTRHPMITRSQQPFVFWRCPILVVLGPAVRVMVVAVEAPSMGPEHDNWCFFRWWSCNNQEWINNKTNKLWIPSRFTDYIGRGRLMCAENSMH